MLFVREYGRPGMPPVIVLHGGPGAAGHMAPVARGLADAFHVIEPFQRGSSDEPLTVARHVADLHEVISRTCADQRPALLGSSWGGMLALAYAASHPDSAGPLLLIGCGTFDADARAEFERTLAERMSPALRARLERAKQLGSDEGLKLSAEALMPMYACNPVTPPHAHDEFDARAHRETWNDMLQLQSERIYPAAFAAIPVPVLMVHGTFDPHPGRLICKSLQPYLPQLEYRELERCGHYPWIEKEAAEPFFALVREWLEKRMRPAQPDKMSDSSG
jgi:pimeloyl-ACP methyl ester carboxylesterase